MNAFFAASLKLLKVGGATGADWNGSNLNINNGPVFSAGSESTLPPLCLFALGTRITLAADAGMFITTHSEGITPASELSLEETCTRGRERYKVISISVLVSDKKVGGTAFVLASFCVSTRFQNAFTV